MNDRFKRINIVNDQVSNWAKRVYMKFGVLTEDPIFQDEPNDLVKVFAAMDAVCTQELANIKKQRDEEGEQEPNEFGEVFNDFATEDFINKNVRVRPQSGVTYDETKDGRQSNVSKGIGAGDGSNEDAEESFNKGALIDLNNERQTIKLR